MLVYICRCKHVCVSKWVSIGEYVCMPICVYVRIVHVCMFPWVRVVICYFRRVSKRCLSLLMSCHYKDIQFSDGLMARTPRFSWRQSRVSSIVECKMVVYLANGLVPSLVYFWLLLLAKFVHCLSFAFLFFLLSFFSLSCKAVLFEISVLLLICSCSSLPPLLFSSLLLLLLIT